MKRGLLGILILVFVAGVVGASGQTAGTPATTGGEKAGSGQVSYYATPSAYERATGKKIKGFSEAPMLADQVKAGMIPALDERLPEEPLVVMPAQEIGGYGGTLRVGATNPRNPDEAWTARQQPLFMISPVEPFFRPNIAKGWDLSSDYKTLTVYLRKGMKWSDGAPFTADDIVFWYEDIIQNKDLYPSVHSTWRPSGSGVVDLQKVDDQTVRFVFEVPYPSIVAVLSQNNRFRDRVPFAPAHYLKKLHIKYNPNADAEAKAAGHESWALRFRDSYTLRMEWQQDPDLPTLDPWVLLRIDSTGNKYFTRSPYYFKVDTEGNQLPYMDQQEVIMVQNAEVLNLKVIAGELDYASQDLAPANFTLYKQNEQQGGYSVTMWFDSRASVLTDMKFHFTNKDPIKAALVRDLRFRQALSLAINRQEINEAVFLGLATPRAATIRPDASYYEDWMGEHYAQYDPEQAGKLFDDMGLQWDAEKKFRLREDGQPLSLNLEYLEFEGPRGAVLEMVKKYWEDIGVKTNVKNIGNNYRPRSNAGELDFEIWHLGFSEEIGLYTTSGGFNPWSAGYNQWRNTDGASGVEPPPEIQEYYRLADDFQTVAIGTPEYTVRAKALVSHHVKNLFHIGVVGMTPIPAAIKNDIRNVPDHKIWGYVYRFWMIYHPDQWYRQK